MSAPPSEALCQGGSPHARAGRRRGWRDAARRLGAGLDGDERRSRRPAHAATLKRRSTWGRVARGWLLAALGAAMLMWTALVNGRPYVFTDTALYYSQAEYLFEALQLVAPGRAVDPPHDPTALPARPGAPNMSAAIDGARSPLYGAPIYVLQRLGGLWLAAVVQAYATAGAIYLLYRAAAPRAARWGYLALIAALAGLTPLPLFASWIMPDVFAGVAVCGLLGVLVYADRVSRPRLASLAAFTAYGLAVHRSNLLDAAGLTLLAAPLLMLGGTPAREIGRRAALVAAIAGGSLFAGAAVSAPIRAKAGEPIGTPPFLTARVTADGVGRSFLRHVCVGPTLPFALCAFRDRPLATSDQILWSNRRATAVFVAADPAARLRMEHEDARFALDAAAYAPLDQARASALDALQQFVMAYVDDPLKDQAFYVRNGFWRRTALPQILPAAAACGSPRGCKPLIGKEISWELETVGLALSALFCLWRLSAPDMRSTLLRRAGGPDAEERIRLLTMLALVLGLLVINAVVCGVLSGPFPRYQARIIWLPALAAGLLAAGAGWRRNPAATPKSASKTRAIAAQAGVLDAPPPRL